MNRDALRQKAKKIYKENTKNIPKNKRIPFSEFFKRYRETLQNKNQDLVEKTDTEDFDLGQVANINNIDEA